jgi:hypothetical protein
LKARDPGRRDAPGEKVLKDRRSPRERRRTGTGATRTHLERALQSVGARRPRRVPPSAASPSPGRLRGGLLERSQPPLEVLAARPRVAEVARERRRLRGVVAAVAATRVASRALRGATATATVVVAVAVARAAPAASRSTPAPAVVVVVVVVAATTAPVVASGRSMTSL